jgi:ubiquinone/menaquinone biosynthesis C-methylase UbiE
MTTSPFSVNQPSFAELYERALVGPLFTPWARLLVDRAALAQGDRVLDVACGTGIVARLVKDRLGDSGRLVGVDLSPLMLAVARTVAPTIEWREANAASLPFEAGQFDVVFCHQGLQFMPEKDAVVRELRRVLAPGGKLELATWRPQEEIPLILALHRVAERHLGPVTDTRHAFGDAKALERVATDAGFRDVRVETLTLPIRFDDAMTFVRLNAMALVGMTPGAKTMSDDERGAKVAAIVNDSAGAVGPFRDGDGVRFDLSSNLVSARTAA